MFFYVKRWITDPEVDPRLSGHVLRPLVSDSHLYGVRVCLWSTRLWFSWEMTSRKVSVFNSLWFDSGYSRRQFMRLLEVFKRVDPRISAQSLVRLRIHAHASDYGGWFCWRHYTSLCALFLVGRPMKLSIMAGMPRKTVMRLAVASTRLVLPVSQLCMPVVCNDRCRVVDDFLQFIDGCGRPVLMLRREL